MIAIQFLDGSQQLSENPIKVSDLVKNLPQHSLKTAVAARIDGKLCDLSSQLTNSALLEIVHRTDAAGLEVIRHSTAHLLAHAVKTLFPEAQVTIGPVIENGFYYDFVYERPFTLEDLPLLEKKMHELAQKNYAVERKVVTRQAAIDYFQALGEVYKVKIIESLPEGEDISLYHQGDFADLCRGPHVPSIGMLQVFKLTKISGAYWRGNSKNQMLQRIYGTAWATSVDQETYLHRLAEMEKRDHRKLGRQLDLFHFQEEAPGLVFWHAKGWAIWQQIERYMRAIYQEHGYQEVRSPQILERDLWEKSGHWDNYKEHMFTIESEARCFAIKPMNCPAHVQIFNSTLHSYRDLPLRLGEFGQCHRNEASGALHGLMRVRGFVQDDGHIFCTEEQILPEVLAFNQITHQVYRDFGFDQIRVKLALRPLKRVGSDAVWDQAEQALRCALQTAQQEFVELPGEGAFYGPKLEYHLSDSLGRSWQCGTFQIDFSMPERLNAEYVAQDNSRKTPILLHRAILGSLERFIGILVEHYAGALPFWLAPEQIVVLNIAADYAEYAQSVCQTLQAKGFRAKTDLRHEKITYKIRDHSMQKLPFLLIVGRKEVESHGVAVRSRGNQDLGSMSLLDFIALAEKENCSHMSSSFV